MRRILVWLVVYAVAMAFVEAAVVVYLRALGHGGPFIGAALPGLPRGIIGIEVAREAATLVMLAAVGAVAGRDRWERLLCFWLAFALWDLGYYAWLRVLSGWPPSLLTWDVLFLIPVPWTAPVLAPALVGLGIIAGTTELLRLHAAGRRLGNHAAVACSVLLGGILMLAAFVVGYRAAMAGHEPERFQWALFLVGLGISGAGVIVGIRRAENR